MSMGTMYPAIVNSPSTALQNAIDDVVTSIEVSNGNLLPDAPNIATIGKGDNAETILYNTKAGNVLSGITRAFQGIARNWPQGTQVSRLFTEYDYERFRQKLLDYESHKADKSPHSNIPRVRAFHNANQSIPNGTSTVLSFNLELFDSDNMHDNAVNNSRLTAKIAGFYQITATIGFANNAVGTRSAHIRQNGETRIASVQVLATADATVLTVTTLQFLNVNDYVEVQAFQASGSALDVLVLAGWAPHFMMVKVG